MYYVMHGGMLGGVVWRRAGRAARSRARAALAVCGGAALLACWRLSAPAAARVSTDADFSGARPAALAHLLADFSAHPLPERGAWSVEQEFSNYTSWRYTVTYECGARCSARATVEAHDESQPARAPQHGSGGGGGGGDAHRVRVRHSYCTSLPMLPWPQLCGEIDTETLVTSGAGGRGARLREHASARCVGAAAAAAAAALLTGCGDERGLRARRRLHLHHLRLALAHAHTHAHPHTTGDRLNFS
ncbi:uncharacterized protein LOC128202102 isoform X2 [Galleria mellonella]|uniref:Uncharacterized protein LOC128202102 isoform X2 n=1 Tax=Galleria mellonella TaxID=7137 RepID=A0ABM3N0N5_GALME|nr:uncharacterized protein LOC128202102 isoform X2 [Galleria mellonella]